MVCSTRLRRQKTIRSRTRSLSPLRPSTNICLKEGITDKAVLPIDFELIGRSRQPNMRKPSSLAILVI